MAESGSVFVHTTMEGPFAVLIGKIEEIGGTIVAMNAIEPADTMEIEVTGQDTTKLIIGIMTATNNMEQRVSCGKNSVRPERHSAERIGHGGMSMTHI